MHPWFDTTEVGANFRRLARREWGQRLAKDFEHICYTYRLELRKPTIAIDDLGAKWGVWDPETRTITLSARLLAEARWSAVLEVLKHEMAHQIVTEVFGGDNLHGPLFRRACQMLAVASWASKAQSDLLSELQINSGAPADEAEERLIRRVEKLLALANSANEHEAGLAMQKVQELYAKYRLEHLSARRQEDLIYLSLELKRKRVERYQTAIASLLADHFFVEVIHTALYDSADLCEYKVIELLGTRENVKMAEYVFHFLENQLSMLWQSYRQEAKLRKGMRGKNSYYLGVLSGFRQKLDRQRDRQRTAWEQERISSETALVAWGIKKDPLLRDFLKFRYPRIITFKTERRLRDAESYEAGRQAGESLVLRRGLEERREGPRLLLGGK